MSQSYMLESTFAGDNLGSKDYLNGVSKVVAETGSDLADLYDHMASPQFALKAAIVRTVVALAVSFALGQLLINFVA